MGSMRHKPLKSHKTAKEKTCKDLQIFGKTWHWQARNLEKLGNVEARRETGAREPARRDMA
jgi:hypothetical protein